MPKRPRPAATPSARLLFAESEQNADMRYFSGLMVPDAFIAFEWRGTKYGVFNALEYNRAQHESSLDEILSLEALSRRAKEVFGNETDGPSGLIRLLARDFGFKTLEVPANFPAGLAFALQAAGLPVQPSEGMFFPDRETKSAEEAKAVADGCAASAAGLRAAEKALRAATIDPRRYLLLDGKRLTAERLRALVDTAALQKGAVASGTICAGGDQACDPHCRGEGPLRADELLIVDVFPRVARTGFHGDMTRTFLKGRASDAQKQLVATVAESQRRALATLKAGTSGKRVHEAAAGYFEEIGYETGQKNGVYQGFFHGTGHGLGLEVHEPPRVSSRVSERLKKGAIVTVEPGLYYPGLGGCRIEDVAWIQSGGHTLLSKYPYRWHLR
ncbi:MAG: M24 family metallopeptidase [Opitutales bacterium]